VHLDPIKPTLTVPETHRLRLKHDQLLSSVAFKLNLRRYNKVMGVSAGGSTGRVAFKVGRYKVDSIKPRVGSAYGCSA
jgi:hypothetical protein